MSAVPSREIIYNKIPVNEYIQELGPIVHELNLTIQLNDLDFPDKV